MRRVRGWLLCRVSIRMSRRAPARVSDTCWTCGSRHSVLTTDIPLFPAPRRRWLKRWHAIRLDHVPKESRMRKGCSLYQYEGQWREEAFSDAALSDRSLVIELERDGDCVTLTTASTDGVRYRGDYRYREGSNSNGEVYFDRYQG